MKILNMLDIVNTTIEKIMTILVQGWSWANYLLKYSIKSNIILIFILFGIFVDNKMKKVGIKKVSLVKFFNILDIVITAKACPGSKMIDRVRYFGCLIQINKSHKTSFYPFLRRP